MSRNKMVGRLILTSGGYLDGQRGDDCDNIIRKLAGNGTVFVVDNATTTGSNKTGVSGVAKNFLADGNDVKIITLSSDNINEIKYAKCLYFVGGDTTPLIELAKSVEVKQALFNYLKNGGNIIGESAGSIIFGENIEYYYDLKRGTKPKYDVILPSYNGFGFCKKHIYPHCYKAKDEQVIKISNYERETGLKIDRLNDGEWIEIDVNKIKLNEDHNNN